MRVVISRTGRFMAKISLQVVPSVAASVLGGYLLAQLVPQRAVAPDDQPKPVALKVDSAPIFNDRAPIRVVPLPQRDGQAAEPPAEVKRGEAKRADAKSVDAKPVESKGVDSKSAEPKQAEAKPAEVKKVASVPTAASVHAMPPDSKARAKNDAVASVQPYTPEPYSPDADLPQVAAQPVLQAAPSVYSASAPKSPPLAVAPSAVASTAPALPAPTTVGPVAGAPMVLAPVAVSAPRQIAPAQPQPQTVAMTEPRRDAEQGTAGQVFSTISGAAGTAANATGDTINWVIGLPGRLIGHDND
jgi:hypothetical protein